VDLNRYWRARYNGSNIEVQWTGFRFQGGWILRLLIDGKVMDERKVQRFARNLEVKAGEFTVNFWGQMFRHRCTISAGGSKLTDSVQPWNLLAFAVIFGVIGLVLLLGSLGAVSGFQQGFRDGSSGK